MMRRLGSLLAAICVAGIACNAPGVAAPPVVSLVSLPGWAGDSLAEWQASWQRSCVLRPWLKDPNAIVQQRKAAWKAACAAAAPTGEDSLRRWLEERFEAVAIPAEALVTGYYAPRIDARRERTPPFTAPLYREPPDLEAVIAKRGRYWSRAEIESGALAGRALEIAWADPIDAFFLHVQGSGWLDIPGEEPVGIAYRDNNRHDYRAIGNDLMASGAIPKGRVSMQTIRAWLRAHPDEARAMMQRNPRFVFFSLSKGKGPRGASGAVLTPERSVAIDPAHSPYGLPVWLDVTPMPGGAAERLQRLAVTQDTGKAIRGPARADFFWGNGHDAGELAGRMKARGQIYLLLPRSGVRE